MTELKMPASFVAIEEEEMVYVEGGVSEGYQTFLNVGKVFNYIARIFSAASSIVNNVNTIYTAFTSLSSFITTNF